MTLPLPTIAHYCPLPGCGFETRHDVGGQTPASLEAELREHLEGHPLEEWAWAIAELKCWHAQAARAAAGHRDRANRKAARAGAALEDAAGLRATARRLLLEIDRGLVDANYDQAVEHLRFEVDRWKEANL